MIDINDIAALLHVEEKLRAHGSSYQHMLAAVRAKLAEHEETHRPKPEPVEEPEPAEEPAAEPDLPAFKSETDTPRRL